MQDFLPNLPATFWLETSALLVLALALGLAVTAIKRAQHRRQYHAWQGQPDRNGGSEANR
jgi:hypothetical protein